MNNTVKRSISGVCFLAIVISGLLLNKYLFGALLIFMMVTMLYEFYRMTMGDLFPRSRWLAILVGVSAFVMLFCVMAFRWDLRLVSLCAVLLLFLMGDPVEVSAYTATLAHERIEVEDTAAAILKFPNGALGVIEGSTGAWPGSMKRIEICGSKGQVVLEEDSIAKWEFEEELPEDREIREKYAVSSSIGGANDPKKISTIGHEREFADFAGAIKSGTKPFIPGSEAMRSVHLIRSIYKSAETGAAVKM